MEDIPQLDEVKEETFKDILINTLRRSTKGTEHKFNIDILNRYLGGVDKAEVITIGGYTSQGKSDIAIQLAIDFASTGKKILFLSGEMTNYEVGRRILANSEKKNKWI
jgi:replicative DNA helicase